ncbi:lipase family protein [Nocardia fluminea]|uniref:lipase family protein n=1 Tax=Nocardia fluminea TaxID=134984 RepID=UPI003669B072
MKCILRRSRESIVRQSTAAAAAAALVVSALAGAGVSQADDSPAAGRPGDVVHVEPSTFNPIPGISAPVDAWKIFYRSTDPLGNSSVVSGRVFVPRDGRTGVRPLVTYAVGTVGMGDQCAPSATGGPQDISGILEKGWAVAVTDYPGLGTPGDHPYLVGRSEGTAVLDAARAAQRLPEMNSRGVTADSPVGIVGYSQGGHASSWAAELVHDYAPELEVKALVTGGVPADTLQDAQDKLGKPGNAGFSLMVAAGLDTAYPELNLDSYLTDEGRGLMAKIRTGCVIDNLIAGQGKSLQQLITHDPLASPDWQQRLRESRLGTQVLGFPAYLFHGTNDDIVPFKMGSQLNSDWCHLGNVVDWHAIPQADHIGAAVVGIGPGLDWLGHRLASEPTQGNCSS